MTDVDQSTTPIIEDSFREPVKSIPEDRTEMRTGRRILLAGLIGMYSLVIVFLWCGEQVAEHSGEFLKPSTATTYLYPFASLWLAFKYKADSAVWRWLGIATGGLFLLVAYIGLNGYYSSYGVTFWGRDGMAKSIIALYCLSLGPFACALAESVKEKQRTKSE